VTGVAPHSARVSAFLLILYCVCTWLSTLRSEEFVFANLVPDRKLYGFCRRFRDVKPFGDNRVDSAAGDLTIVASVSSAISAWLPRWRATARSGCVNACCAMLCAMYHQRRTYFKLYSQLLQLFQWLYLYQSSSISAASQYLVTNLPLLERRSVVGAAPPVSLTQAMATFWSGLQQAITPSVPAMLCFNKERLSLVAPGVTHPFEQVSAVLWRRVASWCLAPDACLCACACARVCMCMMKSPVVKSVTVARAAVVADPPGAAAEPLGSQDSPRAVHRHDLRAANPVRVAAPVRVVVVR
jgi:hypothetical protein